MTQGRVHPPSTALLLMLLHLAACVAPKTEIKGEDRAVALPAARVSVDLFKLRESAKQDFAEPPVAAPLRRNDFKLLLEVDASHGRGEFTQHVAAGDVVSLGGPSFPGPADVEVDFELFRSSLAVRAANRFRSGIGVDGFLGIGTSDLDIELSTATLSDDAEHDSWGPLLGAAFSYSPIERLRFFIEGSVNFGFASGADSVTITCLDFGASVSVCPYAQLTGGWRRLTYEADFDDFVASDLELELSGPLLALWLRF